MSMTRRRLLDDTYKQTATGNPIQVSSLARRGPGIVLYGWTEQGSTEGTNLFDIRKISANSQVSVNGEQIEIRGVSESGTTAAAAPNTLKDYAPGVKSGETYTLSLQSSVGKNYILLAGGTVWRNGRQKNLTEAEINGVVRFYGGGVDGINVMTGIQIEHGEKATAYEPYTGGAPSPSPDYPQEIVSAGKWNDTAQKWEYEITITNAQTDPDKNQTVTLTSDRPLTKWDKLEKRNGQWGWVYKSDEIESYAGESVPGEYYSTTGQLSVGAQVWYEAATETFVPLSASEQEQMNSLHTFRPTTVLSNDAGCEMTLTYKTKKSLEVTT